jgi:hypothetical protein
VGDDQAGDFLGVLEIGGEPLDGGRVQVIRRLQYLMSKPVFHLKIIRIIFRIFISGCACRKYYMT